MERVNNNELFNDLFINMNSNIIVKGEDIKNIIPKENIKLAEDIISKGGFLLSELPPSISQASVDLSCG